MSNDKHFERFKHGTSQDHLKTLLLVAGKMMVAHKKKDETGDTDFVEESLAAIVALLYGIYDQMTEKRIKGEMTDTKEEKEGEKITTSKRFATVKQTVNLCYGFTEPSLRWLIYRRENNGFSRVILKIGRKILIDLDAFEEWIVHQGKETTK